MNDIAMTKEMIEKYLADLRADIGVWQEVQKTLETRGWTEYIKPNLETMREKLNSLEGVNTLEELQVRKHVIAAIEAIFKSILSFESKAMSSQAEMEIVNAQKNRLDSIV